MIEYIESTLRKIAIGAAATSLWVIAETAWSGEFSKAAGMIALSWAIGMALSMVWSFVCWVGSEARF